MSYGMVGRWEIPLRRSADLRQHHGVIPATIGKGNQGGVEQAFLSHFPMPFEKKKDAFLPMVNPNIQIRDRSGVRGEAPGHFAKYT